MVDVAIWPFDGAFTELLDRDRTVIVETYPGDVYPYVGAALPKVDGRQGKRDHGSRAASADGILDWVRRAGHLPSTALVDQLRAGFGDGSDGEDRFDAIIGLLGMLAVARGERDVGIPDRPEVHAIEGWILGRAA
jgi:hypothetical protein